MTKKFPYDKLLIASNNPSKITEITKILAPYDVKIISITDIDVEEPEETGVTFAENAKIKAEYYGKFMNLPALADDSGLSIIELDNYPGVYTANLAGPEKDFDRAFNEIQTKLATKNLKSSPAFFTCSLAIRYPDGNIEGFEGRVDGVISFPPSEEKGFAYDPIFTPNGYNQRFSEMNPDQKNKISHRGRAFEKFIQHCFL